MAQLNNKQKAMRDALKWCDKNDKSTGFAIEFIMSEADATQDEVIEFLMEQ